MAADTNSNVVEMIDQSTPFGVTVDFGNKAKTRVITQVVERVEQSDEHPEPVISGKDVAMFWAFRNGKVVSLNFFVPAGGRPLAAEEQAHGIQQKIGDSYAQADKDDPDAVQLIVEMTLANLLEGRWAKQSEGSAEGIPGLSTALVEAVRRAFAESKNPDYAVYKDEEAGKVAAREYLQGKYKTILDKVAELRVPTGDEATDVKNAKEADDWMKKPFEGITKNPTIDFFLSAIRREKAELTERNKRVALDTAGEPSEFA